MSKRPLPKVLIIVAVLLMVFSIITKVWAQEQNFLSSGEKVVYGSNFVATEVESYPDSNSSQKNLTKRLILLVSLLTAVSLAVVFSPNKRLIDKIKIIEEL